MDCFEYLHSVSSEPEQTRTGDGGVLNLKLKLASLTHEICKMIIAKELLSLMTFLNLKCEYIAIKCQQQKLHHAVNLAI